MNSDHTVTPGQVAYEGYCISLGLTMGFRHFPEDERTAWEAAARAVQSRDREKFLELARSLCNVLPESWYAGQHVVQRVRLLVEQWQRLHKVNAELEAAARAVLGMEPRWIPVSESLPVQWEAVIVFCDYRAPGYPDAGTRIDMARRAYPGGEWKENGGRELDCVTHWMPMPPAPEQPKEPR